MQRGTRLSKKYNKKVFAMTADLTNEALAKQIPRGSKFLMDSNDGRAKSS
jgi:hypothetical protein